MKLVTDKFKSGGLHEKHVVATWNLGNHLSICFYAQGNQEKPVSRWPVAGPSEYWLLASSPASKIKTAVHTYSGFIVTGNFKVIPARGLRKRALSMELLWGLGIKSHGRYHSFPLSAYCRIPPSAPTQAYVNKTIALVGKSRAMYLYPHICTRNSLTVGEKYKDV